MIKNVNVLTHLKLVDFIGKMNGGFWNLTPWTGVTQNHQIFKKIHEVSYFRRGQWITINPQIFYIWLPKLGQWTRCQITGGRDVPENNTVKRKNTEKNNNLKDFSAPEKKKFLANNVTDHKWPKKKLLFCNYTKSKYPENI